MDFGTMKLGELIERMLSLVKEHRLAITPDITLLGRSMVTMEGTLAACAPEDVYKRQIFQALNLPITCHYKGLLNDCRKCNIIFPSIADYGKPAMLHMARHQPGTCLLYTSKYLAVDPCNLIRMRCMPVMTKN